MNTSMSSGFYAVMASLVQGKPWWDITNPSLVKSGIALVLSLLLWWITWQFNSAKHPGGQNGLIGVRPNTKAAKDQGKPTLYLLGFISQSPAQCGRNLTCAGRANRFRRKAIQYQQYMWNKYHLGLLYGSGTLIIDETSKCTLRLVHYSLRKVLQNDNNLEVSLFCTHTGHGLIAKTYLIYLRFY